MSHPPDTPITIEGFGTVNVFPDETEPNTWYVTLLTAPGVAEVGVSCKTDDDQGDYDDVIFWPGDETLKPEVP